MTKVTEIKPSWKTWLSLLKMGQPCLEIFSPLFVTQWPNFSKKKFFFGSKLNWRCLFFLSSINQIINWNAVLFTKINQSNNQLKCGIIYKKIAMRADDDEQRINYEWPLQKFFSVLNWIDVVFSFLPLLEFLFKACFLLKPLVC